MMNRIPFLLTLCSVLLFLSCKSENNGLIPQSERNAIDDEAIILYLKNHYFDDHGRSTVFKEDITEDDDKTPLIDLAEKKGNGYYIVRNPAINYTGRKITNNENDSILIQYKMQVFLGEKNKENVVQSPVLYDFFSTVNTSGYPVWDPLFYNAGRYGKNKNLYEIPTFIEGLKEFNSSNRDYDATPAVQFNGLIIAPSRLIFGRRPNQLPIERDFSAVINFEIYKVIDKK